MTIAATQANPRRIDACLKVCEGLKTEDLERVGGWLPTGLRLHSLAHLCQVAVDGREEAGPTVEEAEFGQPAGSMSGPQR